METRIQDLYNTDQNLWYQKMSEAIRHRDLENIDWDNLAEEIEDMGRSDKRALDSYVKRLIEHLLKLQLWHGEIERNQRGWKAEIATFRSEIDDIVRKNPSLKNYLREEYDRNFKKAKVRMTGKFDIPSDYRINLIDALGEELSGKIIN